MIEKLHVGFARRNDIPSYLPNSYKSPLLRQLRNSSSPDPNQIPTMADCPSTTQKYYITNAASPYCVLEVYSHNTDVGGLLPP
jgi:hypothetical protein